MGIRGTGNEKALGHGGIENWTCVKRGNGNWKVTNENGEMGLKNNKGICKRGVELSNK
jgi:hypothetical protein